MRSIIKEINKSKTIKIGNFHFKCDVDRLTRINAGEYDSGREDLNVYIHDKDADQKVVWSPQYTVSSGEKNMFLGFSGSNEPDVPWPIRNILKGEVERFVMEILVLENIDLKERILENLQKRIAYDEDRLANFQKLFADPQFNEAERPMLKSKIEMVEKSLIKERENLETFHGLKLDEIVNDPK